VLPQRRHLSGDALNVGPDPARTRKSLVHSAPISRFLQPSNLVSGMGGQPSFADTRTSGEVAPIEAIREPRLNWQVRPEADLVWISGG
jgi:hypothetical protein